MATYTEDIEFEKQVNELQIMIQKLQTRRRVLRTSMNENHNRLIHKSPPEVTSHISFNIPRPVCASTNLIGVARYISVWCARSGSNWLGQHQSFGPRFALQILRFMFLTMIYPNLLPNGWNALLVFP